MIIQSAIEHLSNLFITTMDEMRKLFFKFIVLLFFLFLTIPVFDDTIEQISVTNKLGNEKDMGLRLVNIILKS